MIASSRIEKCPDKIIELSGITKLYNPGPNEVRALDDISLTIKTTELTVVSGPSGSGKSTLLHMMALLDRPTCGKVVFAGNDVSALSDKKMAFVRNSKIGIVFQSFYLLPRISAVDNVSLPLLYSGFKKKEASEISLGALLRVGLFERAAHLPGELSGGECQRVAIARAIVNNPLIILADEPTGNLDRKTGEEILDLFEKINEKDGTSVVMITHDEGSALRWGRKIRVQDGKIIYDERS